MKILPQTSYKNDLTKRRLYERLTFFRSESFYPYIYSLLVFFLIICSEVRYTSGDSIRVLLVSQSIVKNKTIKLDSYINTTIPATDYRVQFKNGHYFSFFPIGTSLFSIPFVGLANLFNMDMQEKENEIVQIAISAILCSIIFFIIYKISLCYLNPLYSLLVSLLIFLGSSLISTMGTALWSFNFTVLFEGLVILMIVSYDTGKSKSLNPYLLGFLFFSAYLCRPTAAIFIILVFIYIFMKQRSIMINLTATFILLFTFFVIFSIVEYGQVLPDYYLPQRLKSTTFWTALYCNLLSPSRGISIFSPFLIFNIVGIILLFKKLRNSILYWLGFVWFTLHSVAISNYSHWWGGWSYGPRLLTNAILPLGLITILFCREISAMSNRILKKFLVTAFLVFGLSSIFINTYQGLFNKYTVVWNIIPDIDKFPEYIFNWKYPQFLASKNLIIQRLIEHKKLNK